jgi:hypothetical protein
MSAIIELKSASKDACPDSFKTALKGKSKDEYCPPLNIVTRDQFTVVAKVTEGSEDPITALDVNKTFKEIKESPEVERVLLVSRDRGMAEILFSRLFIERHKKDGL